jgi:hypothetical protein
MDPKNNRLNTQAKPREGARAGTNQQTPDKVENTTAEQLKQPTIKGIKPKKPIEERDNLKRMKAEWKAAQALTNKGAMKKN